MVYVLIIQHYVLVDWRWVALNKGYLFKMLTFSFNGAIFTLLKCVIHPVLFINVWWIELKDKWDSEVQGCSSLVCDVRPLSETLGAMSTAGRGVGVQHSPYTLLSAPLVTDTHGHTYMHTYTLSLLLYQCAPPQLLCDHLCHLISPPGSPYRFTS